MGFNSNMRYTCGVLLLFTMGSLPATAQLSGRVAGSVIDAAGAAVPGADVELYLAGGQKPLLTTKTAADGQFNLIGVRPTEYDVTVSAKAFVKTSMRKIMVNPARETSLPPIKLELASVIQSVDVSAGLEGVRTTNAETAHPLTAEQVPNLPLLD